MLGGPVKLDGVDGVPGDEREEKEENEACSRGDDGPSPGVDAAAAVALVVNPKLAPDAPMEVRP